MLHLDVQIIHVMCKSYQFIKNPSTQIAHPHIFFCAIKYFVADVMTLFLQLLITPVPVHSPGYLMGMDVLKHYNVQANVSIFRVVC